MDGGTVDGRTSSYPHNRPCARWIRGPDRPIARGFRRGAVGEVQFVNAGLSDALNGRIVTEQAKGIVAERAGLDIEAAFSRIRRFAGDHDLRVVDVAHGVIDGTLDVKDDEGTS
jgi:ANTAR domain